MGLKEYNAALDALEREQKEGASLTRSLSIAVEKNPDEEARRRDLSGRTGIPADWIPEFKDEAARRDLLNSPTVRDLPKTAPKTTMFLSDPENASLAHDDVDALSQVELAVRFLTRDPGTMGPAKSTLGIATPADQAKAKRLGGLKGVGSAIIGGAKAAPSSISGFLAEKGEIIWPEEGFRSLGLEGLADAPGYASRYWGREAKRLRGKESKPGTLASYAGQASESIAMSALAAPFGMSAAGSGPALGIFALGSSGGYREYREAGYAPWEAGPLALSKSAMEGLTEKIGLDALYKGGRPVIKKMARFLLGELAGEEINTVYGALEGKLNLNPEMTWEQLGREMADTLIVTGMAVGGQGAAFSVAARSANRLQESAWQRELARRNQETLTALGDSAKASKLLARMPEKFREAVAEFKKDGAVQDVGIPVEEWTTFWQEAGLDPAQVAAEVLPDPKSYSEAIATGSDVMIPLENYVTHLAGSEYHAGLMPNLRLRPGDMTENELKAFEENRAEILKETIDQAEEDPAPSSDRKVYEDVLAQLTAAGRAPDVAAREATLWQVRYRTRAQRLGKDAFELYRERPVKISGVDQGGQYGFEGVSGLIEEVKGSPHWKALAADLVEKKFRGKKFEGEVPLLDRLGKAGRIMASPEELRGIQSWENGLAPFFTTKGKDAKGKTLKWDVLLRSLREEGYLRADAETLDDLVEAIQSDQEAKKTGGPRLTPGGVTDYEVAKLAAKWGYFQGGETESPDAWFDAALAELQKTLPEAKTPWDTPEYIEARKRALSIPPTYLIETPERLAERQRIADELSADTVTVNITKAFQGVGKGEYAFRPEAGKKAYVILGPPASGKSTLAKPLAVQNNARIIDSDDAKERLPEYENGVGAAALHNESVDIRQEVLERSIRKGENIVLPIVGKTVKSTKGETLNILKAAGYEIHLRYVDLPPEKAVLRAITRFKETGRFVDAWYVFKEVGLRPRDTYDTLKLEEGIKDAEAYSNDVPFGEGVLRIESWPAAVARGVLRGAGRRRDGDVRGAGEKVPGGIESEGNDQGISPEKPSDKDLDKPRSGGAFSLEQKSPEDDKRGFIRFGLGGEVEIGLLEKANLSTFLHETGHAWLEELRADAAREDAPAQLRSDWALISKHLGVEGLDAGGAIPTEAHEKFARLTEAYLMEGKAPSAELRSAFARFKAWLVQIYREISRLGVSVQPDVRGVFDRLVATDEEISAAENRLQLGSLFATPEAAGMTAAEFEAHRADAEKASQASRNRLERELIAEFAREKKALWKAEAARMRAAVEEESKSNPVFQLYHLLTRGELLDGSKPAMPVKISKKALVDLLGKEKADRLPPKWFRKIAAKDGIHPDLVAEMFGFSSGLEMIEQLQAAPLREEWIDQETDRRMKEAHGDLLNDGSIAEAAIDAVHNDETGRVLRAELTALRRKDRQLREAADQALRTSDAQQRDLRRAMEASIPPIAAFRETARKTISGRSLMSLRPDLYLRAEEKAGRKAFDAAAKGQFEKAAEEKKKQLLNHYLYLEARKAEAEVDTILRHVQGLLSVAGQERLGLAGGDYLAQVNALLEQYEFRQVTNKQIEERRSLVEWAKEQEELGLEPDIPPVILYNAKQVNYRELKIVQLEDLRDALKNIEHLALQQRRLLGAQADVSFGEAISGLIGALHENIGLGKPLPLDRETRGVIERAGDQLTEFHVALLKAEQFVEWADGKNIGGPWNTYIFQPIADAQVLEGDLTKRYTARLAELVETYVKDLGGPKALKERIPIRVLGEPLTRQAIVAAALNTGNEGNLDKLLRGNNWNEDYLKDIFSHLTARDWKFVQEAWDLIEELWPEIAALQKRMTGLEPKKVEAREFTVQLEGGEVLTLRGGYYPVVYDQRKSQAGAKQADASGDQLFESHYVRATTDKGHTKERTSYTAPILLSLEVIPRHFAQVIHDLTHREPVVQAWRLLQNKSLQDSIGETMGPAYVRMLRMWVASVANDRNAPRTGAEALNRVVDRLRMNTTIVAMGFKATTMIAQALDIVQSFRRVKGRFLSRAYLRFLKNPSAARAYVQERSGEMRHRESNLDRDLRDLARQLVGKKGVLPEVQRAAMKGIYLVDLAASVPTWLGAYEQALAQELPESDAIHWADRTVRLSNPAGGAKDLAAVQRKETFWKLFTMFYSYFNVMYQAQADVARSSVRAIRGEETPSARDPLAEEAFSGGELAIGALSMWMIPALAGELLAGRGPDDDEEPWEWLLRKLAVFPFLSLPFVRDIANAVESGREYQMTPVAGAFAAAARATSRAGKVASGGREPEDLILPAVDLAGYTLGLPTGQAKITGRYAWDLMEGEDPESAGEAIRNLLFYRKK